MSKFNFSRKPSMFGKKPVPAASFIEADLIAELSVARMAGDTARIVAATNALNRLFA